MRAVFLVPRRNDGGRRDRLWTFCKAKWTRELPDIPIFEGHHEDGPFNRSAAINRAAEEAGDWDVGIVIDSDVTVPPEQVREAVARAHETGKVVWAFTRWRGLTQDGTDRLIAGEKDRDGFTEKVNPISWSCCFAIPRKVWDDIGGFDERFRGWGWEDMAWRVAVETLHGSEHLPGEVTHLWHPRSEERAEIRRPDGYVLITPEYYDNTRLGTTYMAVEGWKPKVRELVNDAKAARLARHTGVTLVVLSNGRRDYIEQAIESADSNLDGNITKRVIWDDSGSPGFVRWLSDRFPAYFVVGSELGHQGYTLAMQALWRYIARKCPAPYVFLLEEDFVFERPVPLEAMREVLDANEHLVQLALLRDAFYESERAAGGIIGQHPESYEPKRLNGYGWIEHRRFWTNNPTLFRRDIVKVPWPSAQHSEAVFGKTLFRDPKARSAFWGDGTPWVRHIGVERTGDGY